MTDDEARADIRTGTGWVNWNEERNCPQWSPADEPTITLDGEFTARELLAILHFAPKEGIVTLDELMNDPLPRFVRMVSHEPKDGYNWHEYFQRYEEGDALFRARIKAAYTAEEWRGPTHEGPTGAPE